MKAPDIRLISRDNGVGLSRDMQLVASTLSGAGMTVDTVGYGGSQLANRLREGLLWAERSVRGQTSTQLFLERVYQRCLPLSERNLLMPNPEWFLPKWVQFLPRFERVLCKTHHAESIFRNLGCQTVYTGFTSGDRHDPGVPRRREFFHLAGRSASKGTETVLTAWRRNPQWPKLTVVQHPKVARLGPAAGNIDHRVHYLDDDALRRLQNQARFHLCPSEAEGFGHYLMEALSVRAIVLTTDAAPMNELVESSRGLMIPPARRESRGLVDFQFVDVAGIEAAVESALALDDAACERMGTAARAFFLANDNDFRERLVSACLHPGTMPQ